MHVLPKRVTHPKRESEGRTCGAHRAWVRRHHCSVPCCQNTPIECAHIRRGSDGGVGLKPSDRWTVSLCAIHHAEQHLIGEQSFEQRYALNLADIAMEFARRSPHKSKLDLKLSRNKASTED